MADTAASAPEQTPAEMAAKIGAHPESAIERADREAAEAEARAGGGDDGGDGGGREWTSMNMQTGGAVGAMRTRANTTFEKVMTTLYGDISHEERTRALWLACTLFFVVGGYWLLRSLKDPVLATLCGVQYIPKAKIMSLFVVTGAVLVYNKLIDMLPKHQLFYVIGGFYFCLFAFLAFLLSLPGIGISNTEASPYRILGWVSYCAIESFGSIGVSLFWAFTNSTIDLAGAKKSYGLIVAGAQTGAIAGPTLVNMYAQSMGIPFCYLCGACCMGGMCGIVYLYTERYGSSGKVKSSKKGSAGLVEGLQLFYDHTYVKGIFALSCLFMVEVTILDYTMKVLAKEEFDLAHPDDPHAASQAFAAFMGRFGQSANGLSFCFSLLGTSFVIRRLGLSRTLVLFPTTCLAAVCAVYTAPSLQMVFLVMLTLKGLSYSLNNPCKELLYQPTNAAVKFKAKSWIDVFGARGSKAAGSVVTNAFSDSAVNLVNYGGLVAMGVAGFLIYVATYMGGKFEEFVETGHIVGEDNQDVPTADKEVVMALGQNADDTSCGLEEEGQAPGAGGSGKAERDGVSV